MRNFLAVLVGRKTEADAIRDLGTVTQPYVTTTVADIFVTRYQPNQRPGQWRFMAVARITIGDDLPTLLPDMHLIAVD